MAFRESVLRRHEIHSAESSHGLSPPPEKPSTYPASGLISSPSRILDAEIRRGKGYSPKCASGSDLCALAVDSNAPIVASPCKQLSLKMCIRVLTTTPPYT